MAEEILDGRRCEMRDYDGTTREGKPCRNPAITIDARGRAVCRRHYSKRPEHLKRKGGR